MKLGPQETTAICARCNSGFTYMRGRGRKKRFCSDECRVAFHESAGGSRPCAQCGTIFTARLRSNPAWGLFCSRECRAKAQRRPEQAAENARKSASRRRARKKGATVEDFTHLEVFERDGWKCGLCGKRVDKRLAYPDPMSASLDHIVPLCDGGEHSLRNVQCSHWICNSRKTFGAGGQMRLFG